uniref:Uncharacterized protein n=1 Tax=mine drainage metagenome TaxID=410659 RepID=E6QTE5_9ZZZZ
MKIKWLINILFSKSFYFMWHSWDTEKHKAAAMHRTP